MTTSSMTLEEIRKHGLEALALALGPVGMARFLQQFEMGHGDYSLERHVLIDQDNLENLIAQANIIQKAREQG